MKVKTLISISSFFLLLPAILFAQNSPEQKEEEIFKARVIEILEQKSTAGSVAK